MTAQIKNESIQQPISKIFSDPDAQEALASKQNHSIRNQELQGRRKIIFDKVMDEDFQWNWFWRWPKWVNWLNTTLTCLLPIYGIWQSRTVPLDIRTFRLTCLYAIMTGLSITGGKTLDFEEYDVLLLTRCSRVSPALGPSLLQSNRAPEVLPCSIWWWCCPRIHSLVGARPSSTSSIHGY